MVSSNHFDEIEAKRLQQPWWWVLAGDQVGRWALRSHGRKVTIVNRDVGGARKLALETMSSYDCWKMPPLARVDGGGRATVGMVPNEDGDYSRFSLQWQEIAYELVYKPPYTF